jgi:hypothetical protein
MHQNNGPGINLTGVVRPRANQRLRFAMTRTRASCMVTCMQYEAASWSIRKLYNHTTTRS